MVKPGLMLLAGPLVAALLAGSAQAAPAGFELRKVRPGMTMAEARSALAAAGFVSTPIPQDAVWRAKDARLSRMTPYGRSELTFDSGLAVAKRFRPQHWGYIDAVAVAFTPPPGASRVWGVGQSASYVPGSGPAAAATVDALIARYGPPSDSYNLDYRINAGQVRLGWYFDRGGRVLGPAVAGTCRRAVHDTQLTISLGGPGMGVTNLAALKPDWLARGIKAGCFAGINAAVEYSEATREVSRLIITLVDFQIGDEAAQRTYAAAQGAVGGEVAAQRKRAEQRKVEF